MAVAKLGAIVTQIAGSIGGTQFRRGRNALVMSNKSRGLSKNLALQNRQIQLFNKMSNEWDGLSESDRDAWALAAATFQFPDRFGTLKYLTNRQLFFKLRQWQSKFSATPPDPATLSGTIATGTFTDISAVTAAGNWVLSFDYNMSSAFFLTIQVQKVRSFTQRPVLNKRYFWQVESNNTGPFPYSETYTVNSGSEDYLGAVSPGMKAYLYIYVGNYDGFITTPQIFPITFAAP